MQKLPEIAENAQESSNIFNGKYRIEKQIGQGRTAKVYLVNDIQEPSKKFALKLIRYKYLIANERNVKNVEKEIELLTGLCHDSIIKIHEYGSDGCLVRVNKKPLQNCVYILTDYVEGGNLYDRLMKQGKIDDDECRDIFTKLINTLKYMHDLEVVHRDIKLENILVDSRLNFKLADFGFASYSNVKQLSNFKGSPTYMAPEIINKVKYDGRKADIFAAGVVLFSIMYGIFPFKNATEDDQFFKFISAGDNEEYWESVGIEDSHDDLQDLLMKMLSPDPSDRPSIQEIQEHPWMTLEQCDQTQERPRLLLLPKTTGKIPVKSDSLHQSTNCSDTSSPGGVSNNMFNLPDIVPKFNPAQIENPEEIDIDLNF